MTGGSFVATAEVAEQCGVLRNQITLLVPRNTEDVLRLPGQASAFERYQRIELPHRQLKVRADLESEELRNWLRGVTGRPRAAIHPVWSPAEVETRAHRRHVKQLFSVSGYGKVVVKGVGTGWFGYPARFAAAALAERTPEVLGFWRGLMASRWVEGSAAAVATQAMAEYVATRQMRLRFAGPRPPAGPFQKDAAYRLAKIIARVHGPLGPLRIASIRALIAGFMADAPACLVDGRMSRDKWIRDSTQGSRLLKCDFEEHAFDKDDLACFDPVYDLAGIVLELGPRREIESTLISRYVALTGDNEAGERKVLARLLYGACALERLSWDVRGEYGTAAWRDAAQRWFTAETTLTWAIDTLLADAFPASPRPASATLWSIDVDGVLEDAGLGFPSTTPAAAAALRHMRESGATVVINTGRSLEEVRLRCDALGLDGGVAEYGAAIWGQRRQRSEVLLSDPQLTALDRIREAAASMADVHVDSRFQASIRARRFVAGHFRALSSAQTARLALVGGEQIRVEPGIRQTDFVAAGCNKATGLARFLQTIGFNGEVVAIGDSASDLPMVRFANRAYAPRHHDEALDSLVTVLSQARQRAVLEAARREHGAMGPWPSSGLSPAAAAVVQLLSLRDQPRWARAWKALGRGMFEVLRV
jgi:HAD superfamily hydrolase (TIGR01484 family)